MSFLTGILVIGLIGAALLAATHRSGNTSALAAAPIRPSKPALSDDDDFNAFLNWHRRQGLPAINLVPAGPAPDRPGGSRIGGKIWIPEGGQWPSGNDGKPLSFLAQIDFAEMPHLPDYPKSGVLQFFIGRDDLYGADFDAPERGNFRVLWHKTTGGPGKLVSQQPLGTNNIDDYSPLYDKTVTTGIALKGVADVHFPAMWTWPMLRDVGALLDRDGGDKIGLFLDDDTNTPMNASHVGGHVGFTQNDFRSAKGYADVDRVLLQLWSHEDEGHMWGDVGQGNFMIRREDLLKLDFSRVTYQWDCY